VARTTTTDASVDPSEQIVMKHPDVEGEAEAVTTRQALSEVWSGKGWSEVSVSADDLAARVGAVSATVSESPVI